MGGAGGLLVLSLFIPLRLRVKVFRRPAVSFSIMAKPTKSPNTIVRSTDSRRVAPRGGAAAPGDGMAPPLGADARLASAALCQAGLTDALDLAGAAKQAHWNVSGPNFLTLHELFDTIHAHAMEWADLLAERVKALAFPKAVNGTARRVAADSRLPVYPEGELDGATHLAALTASLAEFAALARTAIDQADAVGDAVTADVLTEVTRGADQDLWFLAAHGVHAAPAAAR